MDWINIVGVIVLPILGAIYQKFSSLDKWGTQMTSSIDVLCSRLESVVEEMKEHNKRIFFLEQRIKNEENHEKY